MPTFIEDLFFGNIDPQARSTDRNPTVQQQMQTLSDNEEFLTATLKEEHKKRFLDYANAWSVVNGESVLDSFVIGFRLGARFTFDTFVDTTAPFETISA